MFTDRFIKVPIKIFSLEQERIMADPPYEDSYEKIYPFEILSYRPSYDKDMETGVNISFKNGSSLFIYMDIEEFEAKLNKHFQRL